MGALRTPEAQDLLQDAPAAVSPGFHVVAPAIRNKCLHCHYTTTWLFVKEELQIPYSSTEFWLSRLLVLPPGPVLKSAPLTAAEPHVQHHRRPVIDEVIAPSLAHVDSLLDEMGYGLRRDQYAQWHRWLAGNVTGEAVRLLMEQDVLPRPPDPAPANFAFIAWKGELPLMCWGVPY